MWWDIVFSVAAGLLLAYVAALVLLWRAARRQPDVAVWRTSARLLPDLVRLLRRLAGDPSLPRRIRLTLVALAGYLVSPLDLVPDFIPVLGYLDDAVLVALALRSVVRAAGPDALERHWPGTPEGLAVIRRLAGSPQA